MADDKKDRNPLDGVTVDGRPLEEWLQKKEGDEKALEIERERRASEKIRVGKHKPWFDRRQKGGPKVARRVVHLTDRQIRKEYGVMAKPFATKAENVLWLIFEQGPLSSKEIAAQLPQPCKINSLTALLAGLWQELGADGEKIVHRERKNGAYFYSKASGVDVSVEAAFEKYRVCVRRRVQAMRRSQAAQRTPPKNEEPEEIYEVSEPEGTEVSEPEAPEAQAPAAPEAPVAPDALTDAVQQVVEKMFGVKVEISGRIEVVFKIGG